MSQDEKDSNPNYATIGGYLKVHNLTIREAFPLAWAKMDDETRQRFLDLPNFDADKFLEITGVDVTETAKDDAPDEIELNGVVYVRKQA